MTQEMTQKERGVTIQQALVRIQADTDLWARPVRWRGRGEAVTCDPDGSSLFVVPSGRGGDRWCPQVDDLSGGWETVTPDVIMAERAERAEAKADPVVYRAGCPNCKEVFKLSLEAGQKEGEALCPWCGESFPVEAMDDPVVPEGEVTLRVGEGDDAREYLLTGVKPGALFPWKVSLEAEAILTVWYTLCPGCGQEFTVPLKEGDKSSLKEGDKSRRRDLGCPYCGEPCSVGPHSFPVEGEG